MQKLLLIFLLAALVVVSSAQFTTTVLCENDIISNATTVATASTTYNTVTGCSMDYVTFQSLQPAVLTISKSTVMAGGLLRVLFGSPIFPVTIEYTKFERDARLIMEGTLIEGTQVTISHSSFDVRSPMNTDTIAIDLRGLLVWPDYASVTVYNNTIHIEASQVDGLVAAVALTPNTINSKLLAATPTFTLRMCSITLNTSDIIAYGLYFTADIAIRVRPYIAGNRVRRVGDQVGSAKATAFLLHFPMVTIFNVTSLKRFDLTDNTVDRLGTFLQLVGMSVTTIISRNTHSHHGPIVSNVTVQAVDIYEFNQNAFRTVYEPWNQDSSLANPTLIFSIPYLNPTATLRITHNELHASRFSTIPLLFPGSTNLPANSSMYVFGNSFSTSLLGGSSLSMSSFAISAYAPPRTVDLGIVYICSNTWPAAFIAATTTTTAASTTEAPTTPMPTTWATVAATDTLEVFVSAVDRPSNVSIAGGDCPTLYETRRPNGVPCPLPARGLIGMLGLTLVLVIWLR